MQQSYRQFLSVLRARGGRWKAAMIPALVVVAAGGLLHAPKHDGVIPQATPVPALIHTAAAATLYFEPLAEAGAAASQFVARGKGYALHLSAAQATLSLGEPAAAQARKVALVSQTEVAAAPPRMLRLQLLGADAQATAHAGERLPGVSNYLIGSDRSRWRTQVPHHARVRYDGAWLGIDVVWYGNAQQRLEYDFMIAPGADPSQVRLAFGGADDLRIAPTGELLLQLGSRTLRQHAPVAWQQIGGQRVAVQADYRLDGAGAQATVEIALGDYDRSLPLVIDPVIDYGTYLGGNEAGGSSPLGGGIDAPTDMAWSLDRRSVALVGGTYSADFTGIGAGSWQQEVRNLPTGFVAKLVRPDTSGTDFSLAFVTYFGGDPVDPATAGFAIPAAAAFAPQSGALFIAGSTYNVSLPLQGANVFDDTAVGENEGFVAGFSADGSQLVYSSYVGGSEADEIVDLAFGYGDGFAVVGSTRSADFPRLGEGGNPSQLGGSADAFLVSFRAENGEYAAVRSSVIGGDFNDEACAVARNPSYDSYVVLGTTYGDTFAATGGAYRPAGSQYQSDYFAANITSSADSQLIQQATYLGAVPESCDAAIAVVDPGAADARRIVLALTTDTQDFPTTPDALQASGQRDDENLLIATLDPLLGTLDYATYFGGPGGSVSRVATNSDGSKLIVGGSSDQPDFQVTPGALASYGEVLADVAEALGQPVEGGLPLGFVSVIDRPSRSLDYSTFFNLVPFGPVLVAAVPQSSSQAEIYFAGSAWLVGEHPAFQPTAGAIKTEPEGYSEVAFGRLNVASRAVFALGASTYETREDAGQVVIPVFRTGSASGAVDVEYETVAGTALANEDFPQSSGVLNWANGDTSTRYITVAVTDDAAAEGSEVFSLRLRRPTGTLAEPSQAVVTIIDDEPAPNPGRIRFVSERIQAAEGGRAAVAVRRDGGSLGAARVTVSVAGGSAVAGQDYVLDDASLSWADGESGDRTLQIELPDNRLTDGERTLTLALVALEGAAAGTPDQLNLSISDDEGDEPIVVKDSGGGAFGWLALLLLGGVARLRRR